MSAVNPPPPLFLPHPTNLYPISSSLFFHEQLYQGCYIAKSAKLKLQQFWSEICFNKAGGGTSNKQFSARFNKLGYEPPTWAHIGSKAGLRWNFQMENIKILATVRRRNLQLQGHNNSLIEQTSHPPSPPIISTQVLT